MGIKAPTGVGKSRNGRAESFDRHLSQSRGAIVWNHPLARPFCQLASPIAPDETCECGDRLHHFRSGRTSRLSGSRRACQGAPSGRKKRWPFSPIRTRLQRRCPRLRPPRNPSRCASRIRIGFPMRRRSPIPMRMTRRPSIPRAGGADLDPLTGDAPDAPRDQGMACESRSASLIDIRQFKRGTQ